MQPLYLIAATLLTCTVVLSCSKDDPGPPKLVGAFSKGST